MSKWGKTQGDSGILRKNDGPEKIEDLLVFGYACKLFRDDEKALEIDQGKHLIPWMGDESLKIDRYDGRAALSDLSEYEGSTEGYDTARWLGLTDAERRVEQLCDEERYRSLFANEDEEELYREEELKRLHQQLSNEKNYGQVSYDYDANKTQETQNPETSKEESEEGEPFVPPPDFDLPINMTIPKTSKQHARIEKTAMFISQQGTQMEILLKAKQAGNPQFDFLSHDSPLHRYYRHILMAIKSGRYKYQSTTQQETAPENEDGDHYLHPSLAPITSRVESAPSIPNIAYKPSADCAYTMLISKIKGKKSVEEVTGSPSSITSTDTQATTSNTTTDYNFPPNSTYIYNYATGKYEPAPTYTIPSESTQYNTQTSTNPYLQQPTMTTQYTAYINNYNQQNSPGTPAATSEIARSAVIYNKNAENQQISESVVKKEKTKHPILPIAEYSGSSDSDNDSDNDENASKAIINVLSYEIPPADVQLIIDKMASYVARNGSDFEAIVRSKGDPRFSFLFSDHVYHAYYKHKLKLYGGIVVDETKSSSVSTTSGADMKSQASTTEEKSQVKEEIDEANKAKTSEKVKKPIAPVSFSIKKAKEPEAVPIERSALPVEESSDENETGEEPPIVPAENVEEKTVDVNTTQQTEEQQNSVPAIETKVTTIEKQPHEEMGRNSTTVESTVDCQPNESNDPTQELIDLTDDLEEKRDAKRAEEKIKDKIAAAAREKLSLLSKNRELQIERRKRAAAFLSKIKPTDVNLINGSVSSDSNSTGEVVPNVVKAAEEDDLLKRIGGLDSETPVTDVTTTEKYPLNDNLLSTTSHRDDRYSIHKSDDKYKHKSSRKKRKKRSSSSESRKHHKRSKHSHHRSSDSRSESRHSKKKYQHRSRSRSRSRHSRSRSITQHKSSNSRRSESKTSVVAESMIKRKHKSKRKSEEKSSGEISSPSTSNYCSD